MAPPRLHPHPGSTHLPRPPCPPECLHCALPHPLLPSLAQKQLHTGQTRLSRDQHTRDLRWCSWVNVSARVGPPSLWLGQTCLTASKRDCALPCISTRFPIPTLPASPSLCLRAEAVLELSRLPPSGTPDIDGSPFAESRQQKEQDCSDTLTPLPSPPTASKSKRRHQRHLLFTALWLQSKILRQGLFAPLHSCPKRIMQAPLVSLSPALIDLVAP